eukprot:6384981-Alexandrium_andersonii.AAC.1
MFWVTPLEPNSAVEVCQGQSGPSSACLGRRGPVGWAGAMRLLELSAQRAQPWQAHCTSPPYWIPSAIICLNRPQEALMRPYSAILGSTGEAF